MSDEQLQICLVSVGYSPRSTDSISRQTQSMAVGLAELDHEVHVVILGDEKRVDFRDGVYIHETRMSQREHYLAFAEAGYHDLCSWLSCSHAFYEEVRSLQRSNGIQIVDSPLWNLDGLVTAMAREIPVSIRVTTARKQIAEIHGQESEENAILAGLEHALLSLADAYVLNSQASVRAVEEIYGLDMSSKVHGVVPHGIEPTPEDDIQEIDQSRAGATVLCVGRLEGRKGTLDLFAAIPEVLREAPKTRFLIAGSDNSHADGFYARTRTDYPTYFRMTYPQCRDRVEFLGFVDEERLHQLYRTCDLFVAPSLNESFGLIFLEAMTYARPTIGCRAGGPMEIIVDGETGLLVPPQDPARLAEAIIRLATDPKLCRDPGRAGRRRLLAKYTHTAMARGFVEIYRQTIERWSG
jgi:glycosyltransferase involved in cell wall biosynthesis